MNATMDNGYLMEILKQYNNGNRYLMEILKQYNNGHWMSDVNRKISTTMDTGCLM
jgi:hypothetical protein